MFLTPFLLITARMNHLLDFNECCLEICRKCLLVYLEIQILENVSLQIKFRPILKKHNFCEDHLVLISRKLGFSGRCGCLIFKSGFKM